MEYDFKGNRVLITGAGRGIGQVIAKQMWELGATAFAVSHTQEDLDSLAAECPGLNSLHVDLTD